MTGCQFYLNKKLNTLEGITYHTASRVALRSPENRTRYFSKNR